MKEVDYDLHLNSPRFFDWLGAELADWGTQYTTKIYRNRKVFLQIFTAYKSGVRGFKLQNIAVPLDHHCRETILEITKEFSATGKLFYTF